LDSLYIKIYRLQIRSFRGNFSEKTMQTPQNEFMQWLEAMLTDDTRRAILRALLEQYELPVIELGRTVTR